MSRYYGMMVKITGLAAERVDAVKQAATAEWDFDDWFDGDGSLMSYAQSSLCGGETEDEFAERLAKAIWAAGGGFCEVEVGATYLDDLPYATYSFDERDFQRLATSL